MEEWRKGFHAIIAEVYTPTECVYNSNQTGLYYQKLPNLVYIYEATKKDYYGVKQMIDKTRITLMVETPAIGKNSQLLYLGNRKIQNASNL